MSIKKVTAALLAGIMMMEGLCVTCFAYDGEIPGETAAVVVTVEEENVPAEETAEQAAPADETAPEEKPLYDMTVDEDGNYTFSFGDWEWSTGGEDEDSGVSGKVNTKVRNYLHLRTGSGTDYEIIGHLLPGEDVKVIGEDGNWYEVEIPGKTGYVYKDYLDVLEQAESGDNVSEELLSMLLWLMMMSMNQSEETPPSALTPDGNLTLIDDIGSPTGEGQQFITLVTKAGNYFYMVIDRNDKGEENVHFMNLVDEVDLFSLMDEDQAAALKDEREVKKQEEPVLPTTPAEPSETEPDEKEPEAKETKKVNVLPVVGVIALLALAGGGYFMMQAKKKKPKSEKPDPDADYREEGEEEYEFAEEIPEESDEDTGYEESYQPDNEELE